MSKLAVFCAGSLGREVMDMAERIQKIENRWTQLTFVDNYAQGDEFYHHPLVRLDQVASEKGYEFVIATGEPDIREMIFQQLTVQGCQITTLIDPTAIVSPTAHVGRGVIVTPYTSISSDAVVEDNVLLQSYIRLGHDIHVGAHSVISANVSVGGGSQIGRGVYVGMGAAILDGLTLEDKCILGMGAVLYKSLQKGMTAIGNPARITKGNPDGKVFHKE